MTAVAKRPDKHISRPLRILIPLIQSELQQGNAAGREHYRLAGQMLIEAKEQVAHGAFGRWLTKNFDMHATTARTYMRWAREYQNEPAGRDPTYTSLRDFRGGTVLT